VAARNRDGIVMALRHRTLPLFGLQFHPESILTPDGQTLLRNFLALSAGSIMPLAKVRNSGLSNRPARRRAR